MRYIDARLEAFPGMAELDFKFNISYFDWRISKIPSPAQWDRFCNSVRSNSSFDV